MTKIFDVFLSHNSKDKPAVRELAEVLRDRGLKVWLDVWELVPGRPWQAALEEIIETTQSAAVLVGKDGLGPWQDAEMRGCLTEFIDRKLPVIPVLLPDAPEKPTLPIFLRGLTWVDLRGGFTEEGLDRLLWGVTGRKPERRPGRPSLPTSNAIRWLHLSDLHLGCRGEDLGWQVQEVLERSVRSMAARLGPPDLLLLSGDLANTGAPKEFERVDRLLDTLLGWLQADPLIAAVPGNHDLQRPQGLSALQYRVLEKYANRGDDEDVRLVEETLWAEKDASFIEPLFKNYHAWFCRRLLPDLEKRAKLHLSHFPGDFCLEIEPAGAFPLCLVGLNSTWQQYKGGDFERKLSLPLRQFQAALPKTLGASPLDVFQRNKRSFLMMHHPPDWLSRSDRQTFFESIYTPDRFDLCLHGHMHEGRTESSALSGGKPRYFFQAPSLFGLKHYGTQEEDRLFGYAWGSLSAAGEVHLWPLKYIRRGNGEGAFVHDDAFPEDAAGVLIRPFSPQTTASVAVRSMSSSWGDELLKQRMDTSKRILKEVRELKQVHLQMLGGHAIEGSGTDQRVLFGAIQSVEDSRVELSLLQAAPSVLETIDHVLRLASEVVGAQLPGTPGRLTIGKDGSPSIERPSAERAEWIQRRQEQMTEAIRDFENTLAKGFPSR